MANNSVEVITLLSSDEDSNTKVESAQNDAKPQKVTARKSIHSKVPPIATATKEENPLKVSKPSTDKMPKNTSNAQTKLANSVEPKEGPASQKKTARKSFKNSNSQSAPKVVSTLTNSSSPQCTSTSSKNETVTASKKHSLSNAAIVAAAKLPGLTITPLSGTNTVMNVKVSPTARKSCYSEPLPKGTGNLSKHFKPSATSTPKLHTEVNKKINSGIMTANRTSSPLIPESRNPIKPWAAGTTVVPTSSTTANVPASLSISTLAKILPGVSIHPSREKGHPLSEKGHPLSEKGHPLSEKGANSKVTSTKSGKSTKTSKEDVPTSLLVSLGKTGVTVTHTTKTSMNEKIPETLIATKSSKHKKESQTVNLVNAGVTITNSLSNVASVNKLTDESTTSTGKGSRRKQVAKENSVVGSIAADYGIVITPVVDGTKLDETTKLFNKNKATHTKLNNGKKFKDSSTIASKTSSESTASNTTKNIEINKISKDSANKTSNASIKKTGSINSFIASLTYLKSSNAFTVLPVSGTSTKNNPPQAVHSKSSDAISVKEVSSQSSKGASKKRTLLVNDPNNGRANKKAKLGTEPLLNGTHATVEDNMKRISALKDSLKKITAKTPKNIVTGKDRPESSDSQSKGLGKDATKVNFPDDSGSKNNGDQSEKLAHKSLNSERLQSLAEKSVNSTKGVLKEKPFKQVTSPKLSLKKRKAAEEASVLQRKSTQAIPLPYFDLEPTAKKVKLNSTEQNTKAIPLPYTPQEPKLDSNSTEQNAKAIPSPQSNVPPNLSSNAQQKDTSENAMLWNSSDSNTTRFKKLLEFSKSFMSATPEEKCTIVKNFCKLLEKADPSYIDSAEFASLMDDILKKIKDSKNTFIHLQTIKTELKAYKRRRNTLTPAKPRHLSSSSEQSESVAFSSKLGLSPPDPSKEVPAPSLGDHLASALHSITSNLNHKESRHSNNDASYPFPSVPSTSKQADIVENLRLSMPGIRSLGDITPVSNGIKSPGDLKGTPSILSHADIIEELRMSLPGTCDAPSASGGVDKAADPLPTNSSVSLEADVVSVEVNAAEKKALFEKLDLQSLGQKRVKLSEAETVNGGHKVSSLPPIPVKEHADRPKSSEDKSDKIEKRVKILEKHLEKLDKKIKKLQSKELSLDDLDDEDSTYILEDRYKKKFQKTWITLCKLKNRSVLVGKEIEKRFTYQGSRHGTFNKAIEKLINRRKATEKFPNFVEVHNLLKKVNEEAHLALGSYEIENAAREAFENVGIELKRRRQLDEERDFGCYLTDNIRVETDPAEQDEELNKKLSNSVMEGEKKIKEIIDKFAAEQREDPNDETVEGSDCEEPGGNEDATEEAMDCDESPANESPAVEDMGCEEPMRDDSLEDLPVGIEVMANSHENTDLPDTAPSTPVTDAHWDDPEIMLAPSPARKGPTDVIEIDSSSNASTEPGPERKSTAPTFVTDSESRIFISDVIEIAEDPPQNYDDSSPDLPSLSDLL